MYLHLMGDNAEEPDKRGSTVATGCMEVLGWSLDIPLRAVGIVRFDCGYGMYGSLGRDGALIFHSVPLA